MLRVKGRIDTNPDIEWSEDGGEFTLRMDIDQVELRVENDGSTRVNLALTAPRRVAHYIFGNVDPAALEAVLHMEETTEARPILEEIRRAMGVQDDGSEK